MEFIIDQAEIESGFCYSDESDNEQHTPSDDFFN